MQINLNRHRSILRLAVPALFATLLGMSGYGAMAQNKPDPRIIVDPYNKKARKEVALATSLPAPQLEFVGKEAYEINGAKGTRYKLAVTNRAGLPDPLWDPAPNLPPCGKNENASRTWVEIFGSPGDKRLAGFCGLRSSEDLGHLWFRVASGEKGPPCVYIVMTDRQTGKKYESNRVCSRLFTVVTGGLKGTDKPGTSAAKDPKREWLEVTGVNYNKDKEREAGLKEIEAEKEKESRGNQAVTGRITGVAVDPSSMRPIKKLARPAQADLIIKQFLFPPTNDKALRVHVVNTGQAASGACRLVVTVRKINGVAVGRTTHVNVPALAAGADVWLHIDAKSILPNNVSLQSTTFRLNVDATEIVAESNEANNEVWHNL